MAASDHKIVCFLISIIIAWGVFEVGSSVVSWFGYKINGTEVSFDLEFIWKIVHFESIILHGFLLYGIHTENPIFMRIWMMFWYLTMFFGVLLTGFWVSVAYQYLEKILYTVVSRYIVDLET